MPQIGEWEGAWLIARGLFYMSALVTVGGAAFRLLFPSLPAGVSEFTTGLIAKAAGLGLLLALAGFLIQVGMLADEGLAGVLNREMAQVLLGLGAGEALVLQLAALALVVLSLFRWKVSHVLGAGGLLFFCFSFTRLGHTVEQPLWVSLLLMLHILGVAYWLGALWPLYKLCGCWDSDKVYQVMRRFGHIAIALVGGLLVAGGLMVWRLVPNVNDLFTRDYGRALLIKMSLVVLLLSLAALNKLVLVPKLATDYAANVVRLRKAIATEMGLAVIVLAVTAFLSGVIGPEMH